jgi:uncharacterized protein YbjT (DUF2867 family)
MVGKGVLLECIDDDRITKILVINRKPVGIEHPKLIEIIHQDFHDLSDLNVSFAKLDACFFCMGISAIGKTEEEYTKVTYDIPISLAKLLYPINPDMVFCYVSGAGTDPNGSSMWARVKGKTEKDLQELPFRKVVLFRPGFIQPLRGIKSATGWYNAIYTILSPFYGLIKTLGSNHITNTTNIGMAMNNCIRNDDHPNFLANKDINSLAEKALE